MPAGAGAAGAQAAGPMLGLLALSTASQMLAQKQMTDKLNAIHDDVKELRDLQREKEAAVLPLAERMLRSVSHYLLDRVEVPKALAADSTFGRLREFHEVRRGRLSRWENVVRKYEDKEEVDGGELMAKLMNTEQGSAHGFAQQVEETYYAFALMARLTVANRVEASLGHPDAELPNVDRLVAMELREIADDQERLTDVLGRLSGMPLTTGYLSAPGTRSHVVRAHAMLGRLTHQLHRLPPAVPVLTDTRKPVLEFYGRSDGRLELVEPTELQSA